MSSNAWVSLEENVINWPLIAIVKKDVDNFVRVQTRNLTNLVEGNETLIVKNIIGIDSQNLTASVSVLFNIEDLKKGTLNRRKKMNQKILDNKVVIVLVKSISVVYNVGQDGSQETVGVDMVDNRI